MQRFIISLAAALCFLGAAGFSAGVFTGDVRKEESCAICRAVRYSGHHYGIPYEHIESNSMTDWYRQHVDSRHGLDAMHAHVWRSSGCTVKDGANVDMDYDCLQTPPLFLVKPEVERAILEQIPDRETQTALIQSLNDPDRKTSVQRARRLIEYYYVLRERATWDEWWRQYAPEFGLTAPPAHAAGAK